MLYDMCPDYKKEVPEWLKLNVDEALPLGEIITWVPTQNFETSSLIKIPRYPRKIDEKDLNENPLLENFIIFKIGNKDTLRLTGVRNEQISAQIGLAARDSLSNVMVKVGDLISESQRYFKSEHSQVRLVKYLPVARARSEYVWSPMIEDIIGEEISGDMNPNVVADVLVDFETTSLQPYVAQPFWFTFRIPQDIEPGLYNGHIYFSGLKEGQTKKWEVPFQIDIASPVIPNSDSYKFYLDLWLNPSSIAGYYQIEHWSKEHWELIKVYLNDYLSRGGKNITTTFTHQPWHKPWVNGSTRSQIEFGYESMIKWIREKDGKWSFDYSIFDKYVSVAKSLGIYGNINAFSLTPFHTDQKIKYWNENTREENELELDIQEEKYAETWRVFLSDFKRHLIEKGWFENTYLGFDEKPQEILDNIMGIIENSAPEFLDRIVIAGHPEASKYAQNLSISYMFFPGQSFEEKAKVPVVSTINERKSGNKITTFYLCAEPAHPNSLTFSPAVESRMIPWLALKYDTDGYLRWAYNNWTSDPFNKPVFLHTQGDDYYVYPGLNGPISSIRWELLKEGIEDFELIKILRDQGKLSDTDLDKAIELATRNQDGRKKSVKDLQEARKLLLKEE